MIISKNKFTKRLKVLRRFAMSKSFYTKIPIAVVFGVIIGALCWYNVQLAPVSSDSNQLIKVTIVSGSSPKEIANNLEKNLVIRSSAAFDIYTRLSNKRNNLQAGTYRLSPSQSTRQIVEHLVGGSVDKFDITFYPGSTLVGGSNSEKNDVAAMFKKAGYSQAEIDYGFNAVYDGPLFAGKPAGTSLEGYVYSETYNFNSGASVSDILNRTFDEFYDEVKKDNLVEKFASHGLNLYQGITMASIIQREVSDPEDQKIVAQIFYSRLSEGMRLESDATYQYICDKLGVPKDVKYDSPYNTRLYLGLPVGPISNPGRSALLAVANPAATNYLYFLSGDNEVTHFAYTNEEHEQNREAYCVVKCAQP